MNRKEADKNLFEEIDRFLYGTIRPEVLPKPLPIYDHDGSVHPDHIRVSFEDGSTAMYDLRVEQPHPLVIKNIEIMRETKKKITQGYVNYPMRRRRRNRT